MEGEIFATASVCTHGQALLRDGSLEEPGTECPLHQGRFDIRCGQAICASVIEDIRTYPFKIENGCVFVYPGAGD